MNKHFKTFVSYLYLITCLLLHRKFGNITHDIVQKYENVDLSQLRKLEKISIKIGKAELDIRFLKNCKLYNATPKFLCFNLPGANETDSGLIRKRLLRSAIKKREGELRKLKTNHDNILNDLTLKLTSIDIYILKRCINHNVQNPVKNVIKTHGKKLRNLTKNIQLPFTSNETIKNFSRYKLTEAETSILKFGLKQPIEPKTLIKTDILSTFESIHRTLSRDLKYENQYGELKASLSNLANVYWSTCKPTKNTLKKHGILKRLRTNKDIVITRADTGNGVVILDKSFYEENILRLMSNVNKFRKLNEDPTLTREGQLQRVLRKNKDKGLFDDNTYKKIYPSGSKPATIYGIPKTHKLLSNDFQDLSFRPIVSSIATYNYNLAKCLSELLDPVIRNEYCAKDSITFCEEIQGLSANDYFLVSYDVCSLFTSIPLSETIEIAVELIFQNKANSKISKNELQQLFKFATSGTHFLFKGNFYDQIDGVSMGSPLGPVLANLFMGYHERNWLQEFDIGEVLLYRRYVDDVFCMFRNEIDAEFFF